MALEFFADHCIPRSVVRAFEEKGFGVAILADHLPTNAPDEEVIAKAQELFRVLITMDGDFADLVRFPPENYGGIIALQMKNHPEVIPQILDRLFAFMAEAAEHVPGRLIIVEPHRIRLRPPVEEDADE